MPCMLPEHISQVLTATVSAAILSTAQEIMYFTKTKTSYFLFSAATTPESPGHDHFNDILENQKPLSLFISNCVPPFSCCFRFFLKFSALKKFTTTGAGYGLLTTSNPVDNIMSV